MTRSAERTYRKALVVRFGGLGDILLSTPSVRAIAAAFPGIEIDYIVGGGLAPVLSGIPYIRRVIEFDKNGKHAHADSFYAFAEELRSERYDLYVNLHPSVKTVALGLATRARGQVVFVKNRRKDALTGRVPHAIHDFAKELRHIGIAGIDSTAMDFVVPIDDKALTADLLQDAGLFQSDRLIVINPAATRLVNRWSIDRFAAVAGYFAAQIGCRVAITGGNGDRALVDEMLALLPQDRGIIDLCGKLTLKQLGAVLLSASAFLTADTGPMHVAAALGTPLVCLSGAADPDRTGPLTANSIVLIDKSLPCVSCQNKTCRFGADIKCMAGISTDSAIRSIEQMLSCRDVLR